MKGVYLRAPEESYPDSLDCHPFNGPLKHGAEKRLRMSLIRAGKPGDITEGFYLR